MTNIRERMEKGEALRASRTEPELWGLVISGIVAIAATLIRLRADIKYLKMIRSRNRSMQAAKEAVRARRAARRAG